MPGFFLAMYELCSYLLKDAFIKLNHSKRISLRVPCRAFCTTMELEHP